MLSRRQFTTCVLCAVGGILAAEVGAPASGAGFTRTVINRQEFPGDSMVTLQVLSTSTPAISSPRTPIPAPNSATFSMAAERLG